MSLILEIEVEPAAVMDSVAGRRGYWLVGVVRVDWAHMGWAHWQYGQVVEARIYCDASNFDLVLPMADGRVGDMLGRRVSKQLIERRR